MSETLLICGTNWLGDSIMSMPAVESLRRRKPDLQVVVLVKQPLVELWRLQPAVDRVIGYDSSLAGTRHAARQIRRQRFDQAVIFPNSFRSAWIPCLARVPVRRGVPKGRRVLLTDPVRLAGGAARHQAFEYFDLLGISAGPGACLPPTLRLPAQAERAVCRTFGLDRACPHIGILPGAARGPSKQWPVESFAAVAAAAARQGRVLVLGSAAETEIGARVAAAAGPGGMNLAGRTSLTELAALLALCRTVICNDSGGMHLAAAVGTPVIAVFGMTDPAKTGPLGDGHRVMCLEGVRGSRRIERDSPVARAILASIDPRRVIAAMEAVLVR